ncbi:MAG TPA: succinate dehydrogenase, cytochrome b556 subunit [Thiobacillaceae bacterium]|nr:succinate dehydrogenase, cytochrome b556 subunit [Thiobacillaceae bacterium]HNU63528.1 succinate dehydrogenase, cytochrome b556 subunit [Thiobacillaceae bacterium]
MQPKRPFFLNLLVFRQPIGAVASILHRASGALLSLAVPALLYAWMLSLRSAEDFARLSAWLDGGPGRFLILAGGWALGHHFLAGLRHLGFDLGWGETRQAARRSAWLSLGLGLLIPALMALSLWT